MSKLDKRYLDIIYPSKSIPTRYDQPLDDIDIHDIKSGIGNNDDCKTLDITVQYEYDRIQAHPVLKPGSYLIKTSDHYLFPNDSIVLKDIDTTDDTFYYFNLIDWPKPGVPIVVTIYRRNIHGYIEPERKFDYRVNFTTEMVNGVETISTNVYEFTVNQDKQLVIPKENFYISMKETSTTVSSIENNCDFVGQAGFTFGALSFTTKYLPITDVVVYSIDPSGNIKTWIAVRDLNKLDYSSLTHYDYVQVIPEFGIIVFNNADNEFNTPAPQDKIYVSYKAYPHIEYVPEFSSFITIPKYLDISPSASGVDSSIVQITQSDEQLIDKLVLKSTYELEESSRLVYGPLQLAFDTAQMICSVYNKYGEKLPGIEVEWHFNINKGTINGYTNTDIIKTITNSSGDTYANYHSPTDLKDLEIIIFKDSNQYIIDNNNIIFNITSNDIYNLQYCRIFTNHNYTECSEPSMFVSRTNSLGIKIKKCVTWETIDNQLIAKNILPIEWNNSSNQLIYDYTKIKPWYYYAPNWNEFYSSISEFPYKVTSGIIINHNNSENQYHMFIHGGIIENTTTEPTWNDELCSLTEVPHQENPSILKCYNGNWTGWTIYTDLLIKIWCTAKDKITGSTIRSNNIYMHVVAPYRLLGINGFRFDTIPESLMDNDPLTI